MTITVLAATAAVVFLCAQLTASETTVTSYLVYIYLLYAVSALAGHTIICLATGAAFPLFMTQMFLDLGTNWAATLLGGITLLLMPISFLLYKYGLQICTKSLFVPCIDLKVAKFLEEERAVLAEKRQESV
jgi:MFS transporter, DHA1 family, multidrug resistance protein